MDESEARAAVVVVLQEQPIGCIYCVGDECQGCLVGLSGAFAQPLGESGWLIINQTLKSMLDETLKQRFSLFAHLGLRSPDQGRFERRALGLLVLN